MAKNELDKNQVDSMAASGMKSEQICKELGVCITTLNRFMTDHNIKTFKVRRDEKRKADVLSALEQPITIADLCAKLGVNRGTMSSTMTRLKANGEADIVEITVDNKPKWQATNFVEDSPADQAGGATIKSILSKFEPSFENRRKEFIRLLREHGALTVSETVNKCPSMFYAASVVNNLVKRMDDELVRGVEETGGKAVIKYSLRKRLDSLFPAPKDGFVPPQMAMGELATVMNRRMV